MARAEFHHFMHKENSADAGRIRMDAGFDPVPKTGPRSGEPHSGEPRPREAEPGPLAEYYANLEIPPGSSPAEVKKAWKRLMKMYHPDLHSTAPDKRRQAEELTRRLTEAYRILDENLKK
ncbi:MAG: J domain-containing protein [Nitrospinaceae bacterium]